MSRAKAVLTPAADCPYPKDNLTGRRFGRLVALEFAGRTKNRQAHWRCLCDCGKETKSQDSSLKNGSVQSCGCLTRDRQKEKVRTHGHCTDGGGSAIYMIWIHMKERCLKHDHKSFPHYGGRGIKVCDRWMRFENFFTDMGRRPTGKQLDRINCNGNYEASNCRWVTPRENSNNRRNTPFILIDGIRDTRGNHSRRHGISIGRLMYISRWSGKANIQLDETVGIPLSWLEETATFYSIRKSK